MSNNIEISDRPENNFDAVDDDPKTIMQSHPLPLPARTQSDTHTNLVMG